jgi:multisubunit Na+/H+ antiporter MnhG subunit
MKFNVKLFNSAQGEPVEVQDIDGVKLEIYSLNNNIYFNQYTSKGSFVIWSSNGTSYRLFIEDLYYQYNSTYYSVEINKIWVDVYASLSAIQKKVTWIANGILVGAIAIVLTVMMIFFPDQVIWGFFGFFILFFISNSIESSYLRRHIDELRTHATQEIKATLGESGYQEMIHNTERHYKDFFKLDEEGNPIVVEESETVEGETTAIFVDEATFSEDVVSEVETPVEEKPDSVDDKINNDSNNN